MILPDPEPIQPPGCIQSHGVLLALRARNLTITQISENCATWLGLSPEALLGRSVSTVLGSAATARLRALLTHEPVERNPLYAFTIEGGGLHKGTPLDVTVHSVDGVVLIELEAASRSAGAPPGRDYYALAMGTLGLLQAAPTLLDFLQVAAREVRRMTGLDRVVVYKFHPDGSGQVLAEEKRDDLVPWLGLRYAEEDIPPSARETFRKIWIRPLPDTAGAVHGMVPLANPDNRRPLDMTHCTLRGASRRSMQYLQNLGATSSLTLSILRDGELWGLIAGHHQTPARYSYPMRAAAELLAQMVSLQLKSAEDREHGPYRARLDTAHHGLLAKAAGGGGLAAMTAGMPNLLDGIAATGAATYDREGWRTLGVTPDEEQLDALGDWLRDRPELAPTADLYFATDRLAEELPAAACPDAAAGLLAIAVPGSRQSLILWFRPAQRQTLRWAGNPHDPPEASGPHAPRGTRPGPRRSFAPWEEEILGRSAPWTAVEIDAVLKLRLLVVDLLAGRDEHLTALNAELVRGNEGMDGFAGVAGHGLKEPLRGIHQYAHYLLDEAQAGRALDTKSVERIETLLRLTLRMDGLLDALLHFSRGEPPWLEPAADPS